MDFEAPNHGGNPFLCDDDYNIPTGDAAALNPFLSGDFSMGGNEGAELNPFLTGGQDDYMQQDDGSSASTNPFAMFGVEETDQEYPGGSDALFGASEPQTNAAPLFAEPASQAQTIDFFGSNDNESVPTTNFFASPERPLPPARPQPPAAAPTSLPLTGDAVEYCAETANIFQNSEESAIPRDASSPSVPGRPPPPRPAPPSRETQQLILSVTGAMEATSFDLLDRLRATKTPSPTPIRDLHSPSPTPDANRDMLGEQETDFFMGDDAPEPPPPSAAVVTETQPQTAANFMDIFGGGEESNHNEPPAPAPTADLFGLFSSEECSKPEPDPALNAAPPPPRPPVPTMVVKPLTPPQEADLLGDFSNVTEAVEITHVAFAAEVTPAPEVKPAVEVTPATEITPIAEVTPEQEPTPAPPPVVHRPPPPRPAPPPPMKATFAHPEPASHAPPSSVPQVTQNVVRSTPEVSVSPPQTEEFAVSFPSDDTAFPPPQQETAFAPQETAFAPQENAFAPQQNAFAPQENVFAPQEVSAFPPQREDNAFTSQPVANTYNEAPFSAPMATAFQPQQPRQADEFDAFAAKFESAAHDGSDMKEMTSTDAFSDPFGGSAGTGSGAWGAVTADIGDQGFGGDDDAGFDAFLSMRAPPPVPRSTPAKRQESADSDEEGRDFTVVIKPKAEGANDFGTSPSPLPGHVPILAPPPARSPGQNSAFSDNTPRFNPFDEQQQQLGGMFETPVPKPEAVPMELPLQPQQQFQRSDSQDTPQTPLFDEDVSQPLEEFPRVTYTGDGWEMHLRQPNKKKITGQRFWKKVFVRLVYQGDNPVLQLANTKDDKDPFQELPLQPCYSISDIGAQQFDQYGKIFTVKLQYVFYKERPGVRPGQVTKAERITNKLSQFAAYAIQGDYQGCKEFGSDLRKLGLPVEHAPQISQLLKIGSQDYEVMKQFSVTLEEALFRMPAHRDRALNYKMEEVQITAVDELYLEQDKTGHVCKQIARVRIFFLGFISGMPDLELGVNDIMRQGKEVVGRHDIIPVITEEWIRLETLEFHSCVLNHEYEGERVIRFKPPDACYIELLRFRVRPPKNRELPLQTKATICVTGNKVEIKCDILVPGFSSRKLGQIPCEDIMLRIPIPESWIYLFRIEKHFRYGSVKSAHRRTGKIKGIERFLGTMESMEPSLIEVTSGSAKYEHQHHAIVWRIHRLPKEGQGAYTNHEFVCRFQLTSCDQIPEELTKYCFLEFNMPSTQASHTTVRSLSVCGDRDEDPPEKCVRHLARMEYRIEIEHTQGSGPGEYVSATSTTRTAAAIPEPVAEHPAEHDSDSDSSS